MGMIDYQRRYLLWFKVPYNIEEMSKDLARILKDLQDIMPPKINNEK